MSTESADWLVSAGELGALIRNKDWSKTPLGPLESWSPALRAVTNIMLANRFPMLLWWGSEWISIYNDAYMPVLGVKHPSALGLPVRDGWSEIYDVLEPLIRTPFSGGPSTWSEDLPLEIRRHGFLEETHWTVAYSPVPDPTAPAGIGGVLATVHEITAQVVGQRRTALLRDLGSAGATTAEGACTAAARILNDYPDDIPFALLYLLDRDGRHARLAAVSGVAPGGLGAAPLADLTDDHATQWPIAQAVRTETAQLVEDLSSRFPSAARGRWPDPLQRALVMPIAGNLPHSPAGVVVVGVSPRLKLDPAYRGFIDLVTARLSTAIANARAYEDERQRADALTELDRAADGQSRGTITSFRDVAERRRVQAALAESEQRFSAIFRESPVATALIRLRDMTRVDANRAFCRLLELAPVGPAAESGVFEALAAAGKVDDLREALAERRLVRDVESTLRTTSGRSLPALIDVVTLTVIGEQYGLLTIRDLSEARRAEEVARLYEKSRERLMDLDALERLQRLSVQLLHEDDPNNLLDEILEAAIAITEADFGTLQMLNLQRRELRIVVQRSFPERWIEFWNRVPNGKGSCGLALERQQRVVVEDVAHSPVFDEETRAVQLDAGVRAVQSTPLLSRSGEPLGMLSTHYRTERRPSDRALRLLDLLARQAADFLERCASETEVRRAEAISSGILLTSADGVISLDSEQRIVRFNKGAEKMFGYAAAEVIGAPLNKLLPERFRQVHAKHVAAFAAGPPQSRRMGDHRPGIVGRRKDGEEFPADISISKVQLGGELVLTATVRDASQELYRTLVELMPDGLFLATPTGRYVDVNRAGCEQFGMTREELLTQTFVDLLAPQELPHLDARRARFTDAQLHRDEWLFRRKDGSTFAGELVGRQLTDGSFLGVLRDVSDRKALDALEARARIEERLLAGVGATLNPLDIEASLANLSRLLAQTLGDFCVVFCVDASGALRRAAAACRDPADEALIAVLMQAESEPPEAHPAARSMRERRAVVVTLKPPQYETLAQGPEQLRLLRAAAPRQAMAVPLLLHDECLGVIGLSARTDAYDERDLQLVQEVARRAVLFLENARLLEREKRAVRARDELLSIVAHDLRNPLSSILMQTATLRRGGSQPERRSQRQATFIDRAARQMNRLIDDLVELSQLEAGHLTLDCARLWAPTLLQEVYDAHRDQAAQRSLVLKVERSEDVCVRADSKRMLQVFDNLVGNALKFTSQGAIALGVERRRADALFWVADSGVGIAPNDLLHLFDRFYQARTSPGSGAGLGLSIVKGLVEAHGGRVWVESAPAEGTRVFFTLPLAGPDRPANPMERQAEQQRHESLHRR